MKIAAKLQDLAINLRKFKVRRYEQMMQGGYLFLKFCKVIISSAIQFYSQIRFELYPCKRPLSNTKCEIYCSKQ